MRIALASCERLPEWEVDDLPLHAALTRQGIDLAHPAWTDPTVDWERFDGVLIRTTWDYAERRPQFVRWAHRVAAVTTLFNPATAVEWNTCKSYLADLDRAGVPTIPTITLNRGTQPDLGQLMTEAGWRRGFIKPRIGATARGTHRFELHPASLRLAHTHLESYLAEETLLLQPYLDCVETQGEWSAVLIDGLLTHAVRKRPRPGDYRVQDDFGGTDEPLALDPAQQRLVHRTLEAINDNPAWTGTGSGIPLLYARVDGLGTGNDALINEVEIVEPSLFFRHAPDAAETLATALIRRCRARV